MTVAYTLKPEYMARIHITLYLQYIALQCIYNMFIVFCVGFETTTRVFKLARIFQMEVCTVGMVKLLFAPSLWSYGHVAQC